MKNESKLTWKDVVKEALSEIGNSGHLDDIYSKIKGHPRTETNPTWRDTLRRTLQQYSIFYQEEKGSGTWYLRKEKPLEEFDPKKNPNPAHEDVQGMLLELGKIYGYETSAAINDAKKKFMNIPRSRNHKRIPERCISTEGCRNSEPYRRSMVWRRYRYACAGICF